MDTDTSKKQEIGRLDNTNNTDLLSKNKKNTKLVEFKQVKETPFTLAKQNEEWYILLGKYRLSEGYETEKEAEKEAKRVCWNKIMQVNSVIITEEKQLNK